MKKQNAITAIHYAAILLWPAAIAPLESHQAALAIAMTNLVVALSVAAEVFPGSVPYRIGVEKIASALLPRNNYVTAMLAIPLFLMLYFAAVFCAIRSISTGKDAGEKMWDAAVRILSTIAGSASAGKIDRESIAMEYIAGNGIEIGALHNPLKIPPQAKVRYLDRMTKPELLSHYPDLRAELLVKVDIVDDGQTLATVPSGSQDFIIANHFIEHCENPILAIENMLRAVKPGGIVYLSVPDKTKTFDRDRPVTTIEHLVQDYEYGPQGSKKAHFEEYIRLIHKPATEDEYEKLFNDMYGKDYSIHYHVWTPMAFMGFLSDLAARSKHRFGIELSFRHGDETTFILRREQEAVDN